MPDFLLTSNSATINGPGTPVSEFTLGPNSQCEIDIVFLDTSIQVTNEQVLQGFSAVSESCFVQGAGGTAVSLDGKFNIAVKPNPEDHNGKMKLKPKRYAQGKRQEPGVSTPR